MVIAFSFSACGNSTNTKSNLDNEYNDYENNNEYNTEYQEDTSNNESTNNVNNTKPNNTESKTSQYNNKNTSNNKTYKVGETWVVNGCWEFTINSVTTHYTCNSFSKETYNKTNKVIVIDYTYKNLGFRDGSSITKLHFASYNFSVSDANGNPSIGTVPCTHAKDVQYIYSGASCNAQAVFAMQNNANISNVTIIVGKNYFADANCNNYVEQVATYKVSVTQEDQLSNDNTNNSNNNTNNSSIKEETTKDKTLWEYSETVDLNENAQEAFDYVKEAKEYILKTASYGDTSLKINYYNMAKRKIERAKYYLNKAKKLVDENQEVKLTTTDYKTAKEHINATISLCDNLINFDINETNCESVHMTFQNDSMTLLNQCLAIQAYSLKMVESFAK